MLYRIKKMLEELPEPQPEIEDHLIIRPEPDEDAFTIEKDKDGWRVKGKSIERLASMTYWEFEATTRRFQQILDKMGISNALVEAGVVDGDTVFIGDEILEWSD
jgi:GTP-binding protein